MKCNQSRAGFELVSPCPFPTTITITVSFYRLIIRIHSCKDRAWEAAKFEWGFIDWCKVILRTCEKWPTDFQWLLGIVFLLCLLHRCARIFLMNSNSWRFSERNEILRNWKSGNRWKKKKNETAKERQRKVVSDLFHNGDWEEFVYWQQKKI